MPLMTLHQRFKPCFPRHGIGDGRMADLFFFFDSSFKRFLLGTDFTWAKKGDALKFRDFYLGGGFKHFLFSPLFGEMIHFDRYFSTGLKPPSGFYHNFKACSWLVNLRPHNLPLSEIWGLIAGLIFLRETNGSFIGPVSIGNVCEQKGLIIQGSLNYPFYGDQTMQMYGDFVRFPLVIVHSIVIRCCVAFVGRGRQFPILHGDSLEMAFLAMDPVIGCINSFGRISYIINKQGIWRLIFFSHLAWMREFDFPFRQWNIQSVYTSFANIYNFFQAVRDQQMLCLSHPNPAQFTGLCAKDHDAFLCLPPTSDPRGIAVTHASGRIRGVFGLEGGDHEPHQLGCPLVEPRFELNRYRKKG